MKPKVKDLKRYAGLEYLTLTVPVRDSPQGEVIDADPAKLERLVAKALIKHRVPLRGREVRFLRKVLGLSLEKFAHHLGLTSGSVFKWEKAEADRIHSINEIAVRAFVAEELDLTISGKYSELLANDSPPVSLTLKAA